MPACQRMVLAPLLREKVLRAIARNENEDKGRAQIGERGETKRARLAVVRTTGLAWPRESPTACSSRSRRPSTTAWDWA